jgi:hypothetical protein
MKGPDIRIFGGENQQLSRPVVQNVTVQRAALVYLVCTGFIPNSDGANAISRREPLASTNVALGSNSSLTSLPLFKRVSR